MEASDSQARLQMIAVEDEQVDSDLSEAVRIGLTTSPKYMPCRFFYDESGSQLFEQICELPEYYLTRTEHEILKQHADEITGMFAGRPSLVELGSGSSLKTRVLIEAFLRRHGGLRYVPVDISRTMLEESSQALLDDYPSLQILAIAAEYRQGLRRIRHEQTTRKLVLWLGSSVGNLTRENAARFLTTVRASLDETDRMLIGVDLKKDAAILEAAYDDSAGVTARFNKNVLTRINSELGADFDEEAFEHVAIYNETAGRVEMHLKSREHQVVYIQRLDLEVEFEEGETIHTENSHKYSHGEIETLAAAAGMRIEHQWIDDGERFSVNLLAPEC